MAVTSATVRNVRISQVPQTGSEISFTIHSNMHTICLQAIGADATVAFVTSDTTNIWTLKDGLAQSFQIPELAGATLYIKGTNTYSVQIIEILRSQ